MASMADLLGPPPDAPPSPGPRLCEGGCGGMVAPFWLAFSRTPGWWQPRFCEACQAAHQEQQDRERAERGRREALRDRIRRAGLIEGLAECTFENFGRAPGTREALSAALSFAASTAERLPERGIMFVGGNGSG